MKPPDPSSATSVEETTEVGASVSELSTTAGDQGQAQLQGVRARGGGHDDHGGRGNRPIPVNIRSERAGRRRDRGVDGQEIQAPKRLPDQAIAG